MFLANCPARRWRRQALARPSGQRFRNCCGNARSPHAGSPVPSVNGPGYEVLPSGREDCIAHCWNEWRDARLSDAGRLSIALYEVHETALHESMRRYSLRSE
jgi:hypothetical protein